MKGGSPFTRSFNDRELKKVVMFLAHIEKVFIVNKVKKKLLWKETKDGIYLVKSMCLGLRPRSLESFLVVE